MSKQLTLAMIFFTLVGCGQPAPSSIKISSETLIQGELTEAKYIDAASMLVAKTSSIVRNKELTEEALKQHIAKISFLLSMSKQLDAEPKLLLNAELISSLGSLYSKQSVFHANNVQMAGSLAAKGFRYLDMAVNKYPDNVTARLNRGLVSANVPEFLNKTQVAITDLEYVLAHEEFPHLAQPLQQVVKANLKQMTERVRFDA